MPTDPKTLAVSLVNGIAWTDNWRNSDHTLPVNSFLFDAEDFRAILQEPTVSYVRLYLGLAVGEKNQLFPKLLCVGANKDQQDILASDVPAPAGGNSWIDLTGIYDFSHPCPPLCEDPKSPLAGG